MPLHPILGESEEITFAGAVMPSSPARILVVDDDADLRGVIAAVIRAKGYDVVEAANGAVAMDVLREDASFSLILLDLVMPVMDGWRFRVEQEWDASLASIPVVVMSTFGSRGAEMPPPATAYLEKPFRLSQLADTIKSHARAPTTPETR
ncbi:MAG TPA: response regulator [Solirubrobacterales bacterium]